MADKFENITIVKKANVYFDGKVTSRTVFIPDGTRKTLGYMMPGEYEIKTGEQEVIEILIDKMEISLPVIKDWKTYTTGQTFEVPANTSFKLRLNAPVDYCCSYG